MSRFTQRRRCGSVIARRHLSRDGFEGMSIAAIAAEAGTTRQALYRRWPTKSDLEVALTMCTGSWYGRALASDAPPEDWPVRAARLVWRALGGELPGTG